MSGQVRITGAALMQAAGALSTAGRLFQDAGSAQFGADTGADAVSSALERVGRALRRVSSVSGERAAAHGRAAVRTQRAFRELDAGLAASVPRS